MGWGDEIIVTGEVARMYARDPRRVRIVYEEERWPHGRWHEAYDGNPKIARFGERGDFQELRPRQNWQRPYCAEKTKERWRWLRYAPPRGELYFTPAEIAFAARYPGRVVLEPHIKPGASPNKQWGWVKWNKLAWLMRERGIQATQIGPGTMPVLDGAERVQTNTMRLAAALVARARLVVTAEGGLHHVAAAVGTPAVVIYGGYISPEVTGYPEQRAFFVPTEEWPIGCGTRVECKHCKAAMEAISPEEVFRAVEETLGNGDGDRDGDQGMARAVAAGG